MEGEPIMIRLSPAPTGEDIVAALEAEAARRGITALELVRPLSPDPSKWLSQVMVAQRPKPATIARVEAVLAGHLTVPEPARVKRHNSMARRLKPAIISQLAEARSHAPTDRPSALRAEIAAETAKNNQRRWLAHSTGTVVTPLALERSAPIETFTAPGDDRRPYAFGRDPCPRCNIRAEVGCRHQRPDPDLTPIDKIGEPR